MWRLRPSPVRAHGSHLDAWRTSRRYSRRVRLDSRQESGSVSGAGRNPTSHSACRTKGSPVLEGAATGSRQRLWRPRQNDYPADSEQVANKPSNWAEPSRCHPTQPTPGAPGGQLPKRNRRRRPYWIAALPMLTFVGVVGAAYSLLRGRRRSALAFGLAGVGSAAIAIWLYYTSG